MSACAQVPAKATSPVEQPVVAAPEKALNLPNQELNTQLLYEFLLAEMAGQRGNLKLASDAYLDLAQKTNDPRVAKRATEVALFSRLPQQAYQSAKIWMKLEPDADQPRQATVALLINAGHLEEARPLLEQLIAGEEGNRGAAFLHLNSLLSKQANKKAVLELVKDLAKPYPQVSEAHYAIAQAAWAAEQMDLALTESKEAARLRPDWEFAVLLQGQLLQRTAPLEVPELYQTFLKAYPKAREVRLAYARFLVNDKKYEAAREEFQKLLKAFPDNAEVTLAVGLLSLQLNDFDAAETYFKQVLDMDYKDDDSVYFYLGQLNEERNQLDEAIQSYERVGKSDYFLPAQIKIASILVKQGKVEQARKRLHQVPVQNNQQRAQLIQYEAQIFRDAKDYKGAFDVLNHGLEKLPNYPDLLYDRAMIAEKLNKMDVLEKDLRKLIQLKPDYAHAYNALGYTLADHTTRLDEALKLIEKALQLSPDDPFIMDSLGWVQHRMGKNDKAAETLKRAFAIRPDPEIAAHLGEVLWAQNKHDEALVIWQSALKDAPQNEVLIGVLKKYTAQ
ncbi:tetratricopeptide repeat protein [Sulfurirhabdus autotrophica]|uniref:Tetratricopeptide repeat protein n=2 Tax=Sulfurirhabdus autotrophica TaxID=1706046 RepID=A0A4R3Y324_9PROT|nr:tetratricopeptide repeat protein [Sulfurirhabdus autotrophica]